MSTSSPAPLDGIRGAPAGGEAGGVPLLDYAPIVPERPWPIRYGVAVAAVVVASGLTGLVWARLKPQVSPLFFLSVMTAAWYGGLGPALLATALSGFVSIYVFSDPIFSLDVDVADMLRVGSFSAVAVAVSAIADGRRRAEEGLRAAHDGLERRVAERTRELAELNEALRGEVAERRRAENALVQHQARLRELADEVVLAEQRERRQIAERLHDELGQILALSQIRLGGARDLRDPQKQAQELDAIEGLVEEAVSRTRSITCELSPPVLYELGLPAALHWLAGQFRRQCGAAIDVKEHGDGAGMSEEAGVTLFHVARELLANVRKHSRARNVGVALCWAEREVSITVRDDGVGFEPALPGGSLRSTSFGLFSARERLKRYGGSLSIDSRPGNGAVVTARLPLVPGECVSQ